MKAQTSLTLPSSLFMSVMFWSDGGVTHNNSNALSDHCTGDFFFCCQLCHAIVNAGLPWKKFPGITTDGALRMTGRKNGLVAEKTGRGGGGGGGLCSVPHYLSAGPLQQMPRVWPCEVCHELHQPNQIQALAAQAFPCFFFFKKEIESEYENVLYFTDVC